MGQCVEPVGPGQPKDGGGGIGPLHQDRCFLFRAQHRSGSSIRGLLRDAVKQLKYDREQVADRAEAGEFEDSPFGVCC
jgi:hypothetical protein